MKITSSTPRAEEIAVLGGAKSHSLHRRRTFSFSAPAMCVTRRAPIAPDYGECQFTAPREAHASQMTPGIKTPARRPRHLLAEVTSELTYTWLPVSGAVKRDAKEIHACAAVLRGRVNVFAIHM